MEDTQEKFSNQFVFNRVWQHFVVEGNPPCVGESGTCFYRGEWDPNQRCAVGLLIPDDRYNLHYEGLPVKSVADDDNGLKQYDLDFLAEMQDAHDSTASKIGVPDDSPYYPMTTLREGFTYLAEKWGLGIPEEIKGITSEQEITLLKTVRAYMIPGMEWTDNVGQCLKQEIARLIKQKEAKQ